YIDPVDPPPGYGMFAHVQLSALEERAQAAARPSSAISASMPDAI
ncbi:MAG: hypothetical protein QOD60_1287, partial [Solirubrobacterales bacterium]|nr:hypothetical protein [Solirubrobacterales bacterium]